MSDEPMDLCGLSVAANEAVEPGDVWLGNHPPGPSQRLLDAFVKGEVTVGGMAEAGWRYVGRIKENFPRVTE